MTSARLRIRLFGALDLQYGEARVPGLDSARAESLLAYLLLHRAAPQSRQHLAFLLWPDSSEAQARTNLRHVLHTLRHALPDWERFLDVGPRTLRWRADAPFDLDVAAFEAALARAAQEGAGAVAGLRDAVELYTADLLEGYYDDWLLAERDSLRRRYLAALERLAATLEACSELEQALLYAERLQRADPLQEESYRLLMRLYAARGDRARAVRVYHACAAVLERELGVEPSAATRETYEALLPPVPEPVGAPQVGGRIEGAPLVGRSSEWERLTGLWRAAEAGRSHCVLVSGEPGIGKTRLVEELRAWCAHRDAITAEGRSYAAEGTLAYGPVVAWLRSAGLRDRVAQLAETRRADLARLLPELRVAGDGRQQAEALPESEQRLRLFETIAHVLLAPGPPLLLVADDLQWCDQESLQLMHYLLRVAPAARLLLAATARREELDHGHPLHELLGALQRSGSCSEIPLARLTSQETAALAGHLVGAGLDAPDSGRLFRETEGNPLFVVEAVNAGWKPGDRGTPITARVQAVIEARLERLSAPAHELVGAAATIGRAFTVELLALAGEAGEEELVGSLDDLWRRRIIREQGVDAYDFSHDRIREVAYLALSPARRRRNHLRVARALEALHAADPAVVSGQLAAHYDRAGATDQAIAWYEAAADMAQQLYAGREAIRLLGRALELLRALPETCERREREVAILTALCAPLIAVAGYRSGRLTEVQEQALAITRGLGAEPSAPLLRSLAVARLAQDDFAAAEALGEQLRRRAEREGDDVILVESAYVLGVATFWQGKLAAARAHFETAVARYRPEHRREHLLHYGQDPEVVCLSRLGNTLWLLGRPAAARRARDAALARADEIGHPVTRSAALTFSTVLALEMRDLQSLRASAARLIAESIEHAAHVQVGAAAFAGYLEVLDGHSESGLARIQSALDDTQGMATAPGLHAILARLQLEACAAAGDAKAGLVAAEHALDQGDGTRLWEAEARRLRAAFLAALGAPPREVEAELLRALDVARRQGARALELRAAASLRRHRIAAMDVPLD